MKNLLQIGLLSVVVLSFLVTKKTNAQDNKNYDSLSMQELVITPPKPASGSSFQNTNDLSENPNNVSEPNYSLLDNLFFKRIQRGFYTCGLPISELAGTLTSYSFLTNSEKNQLMQIALDFNNCCATDSDLWWMYEGHKTQKQALIRTCDLKQKQQNLTFVNALAMAGFLSTCPALAEYIDTMIEPYDSRLGVLLIIEKAKEQKYDHAELLKIKTEVEKDRAKLLQKQYNISYRFFEVKVY